jgi:hypothetical protein
MNEAAKKLREISRNEIVGPNFTGEEYYQATNPGVQFIGGSIDWANEAQTSESFKITITNNGTSAEDVDIAICPGMYGSAGAIVVPMGTTIDGIIADGTVINTSGKEVTCSGAPSTILEFKDYILKNPTRFTKMQIRVSDAEQLQEQLHVIRYNPFKGKVSSPINPATYIKEANNNDKLVAFMLNDFQLDHQTVVYLKVLAGVTMSITMWPGATANNAAELAQESKKALRAGKFNHEAKNL